MLRDLAWVRALIGAAALCLAAACDEDELPPDSGTPGGILGGTVGGILGGSIGGSVGGSVGGGPGTSSCPGLPDVQSYDTTGPFSDVVIQDVPGSGAGEGCTLFRPGSSLGANGFK